MIASSIQLVFGLALIFAPHLFAARSEAARLRRLQEIREGDSERYFEEERDLLAYGSDHRFLQFWRVIGASVAAVAALDLIEQSGIISG
jgi:anti-sigma-K factor RskA